MHVPNGGSEVNFGYASMAQCQELVCGDYIDCFVSNRNFPNVIKIYIFHLFDALSRGRNRSSE